MPDAMDYLKPDAHLGQGIAFPMRTSVQGGVQLSAKGENLAQSIRLILQTRLGERVYRPDFGCRLSELTFAPMNIDTLLLIRLHVREALEKWEPRIVLNEVSTDPDPMRGRVDIIIHYHAKDSSHRRNIVYPFYLMSPE
ncbi:GPW/gp25 family protein [Leptolyngbya sp. AN02str]|uniref:GPW/gp25 family protein n=1 Tax=Leptolyngbya sp. AN02str TaxID=3423363 RepID=UPI003D31BBC3